MLIPVTIANTYYDVISLHRLLENNIKAQFPLRALMRNDVEASQYDIGTTHIRLVRAGNVVQILFSSSLEAGFLYKELAARYKRAEDKLKGA